MDTSPESPHSRRPAELRQSRAERYAEIAERHAREDRVDRRIRFRFWLRTAGWCWLWAGIGLVLAAFAFRVTDVALGEILLLAGQLVTFAGVLGTLGHAVVQAEKQGWL